MSIRRAGTRRPLRPPLPADSFLDAYLDPLDRLTQIIYSVLIVLTFTLAYRIFRLDPGQLANKEYIDQLLWAVLGATLASSLIEGILYVLIAVFDRSQRHRLLYEIQTAPTDEEAREVIADSLDYFLEPISSDAKRDALYADVLEHLGDSDPRPIGVKREDLSEAAVYMAVAFAAVLPSLLPIVLLPASQYALAVRLSNIISFIVLFAAGYRWGRYTGTGAWKTGLLLVGVGLLLVGVAILLGG